MDNDPLVPVFMPSLVTVLLNAERLKGSPLTREEVLQIRDQSTCVMVKRSQVQSIGENRGCDDINPENCWEEFLRVRAERSKEGGGV
jgi:hypothetical protein